MTEFTPISSGELREKISALDANVAELTLEKGRLSFRAVSGDQPAAARLDEIRDLIGRADFDRGALQAALVEAERLELAASKERERRIQEAHIEAAGKIAIQLRAKAERADAMAVEYQEMLTEIDKLEAEIRSELVHAKLYEKIMQHSRFASGISNSVAAMFASLRGPAYNRSQPMVDIMDVAWRSLPAYAKKFGAK